MKPPYTCPCGQMKVEFPGGSVAKVTRGWMKGSPAISVRCFDCHGEFRIAYTVHFADKDGVVFHPSRTSVTTKRKATKKRKPKKEEEVINWTFKD